MFLLVFVWQQGGVHPNVRMAMSHAVYVRAIRRSEGLVWQWFLKPGAVPQKLRVSKLKWSYFFESHNHWWAQGPNVDNFNKNAVFIFWPQGHLVTYRRNLRTYPKVYTTIRNLTPDMWIRNKGKPANMFTRRWQGATDPGAFFVWELPGGETH